MRNILKEIVLQKKANKKEQLLYVSQRIPEKRTVRVTDFFGSSNPLIAELKRSSPSAGMILENLEYEKAFVDYKEVGLNRFSILTENKYFGGDIADLIVKKKENEKAGFLRKDFILFEEEIVQSYLGGADAVLLIAEILDSKKLQRFIIKAQSLGIQTLCEVHSERSLQKVLNIYPLPTAIGINTRDLKSLSIDLTLPLKLIKIIPKGIPAVYESGVDNPYMARLIANAGFAAILAGEKLLKSDNRQNMIKSFLSEFKKGKDEPKNFFTKLFSINKKRYIKVCGITRKEDAKAAVNQGADVLGFILCSSPRKTTLEFVKTLSKLRVLKIAVVKNADESLRQQLFEAIRDGFIDGVQCHGRETPEEVYAYNGNAYKVIEIQRPEDLKHEKYLPTKMYDANKQIGKKNSIPFSLRSKLRGVWIAGGIDESNIRSIIRIVRPELVDICSGVEKSPGLKDIRKISLFMERVNE